MSDLPPDPFEEWRELPEFIDAPATVQDIAAEWMRAKADAVALLQCVSLREVMRATTTLETFRLRWVIALLVSDSKQRTDPDGYDEWFTGS